jgi:hypothetical protein
VCVPLVFLLHIFSFPSSLTYRSSTCPLPTPPRSHSHVSDNLLAQFRRLSAAGAPIDGIGLQSHMSASVCPENTLRKLDRLSAARVPIWFTEVNIHGPEAQRAQAYGDLLTVAYSHPSVEGFMLWGFWEGAIYRNDSALVNSNWSLNAAGQQVFGLIDQWKTRLVATTDANGTISFRGACGTYTVALPADTGTTTQHTVTVDCPTGPPSEPPSAFASGPIDITLMADYTPSWTAPAVFDVTNVVINPRLERNTATTYNMPFSSWLSGSGYEPFMWRNRIQVGAPSPNSILAPPSIIDGYNMFREGLLDGASVRVYRIVNGTFKHIRTDTVVPGGHRASGWNSANAHATLVAPGTTTFNEFFDDWWRSTAPYYYAVMAIDVNGIPSPASNFVAINRSVVTGRPAGLTNVEIAAAPPAAPMVLPSNTTFLPTPTNFRIVSINQTTGVVTFAWDPITPVAGGSAFAGYRVVRSDYIPTKHRGYGFDLSQTPTDQDLFLRVRLRVVVYSFLYERSAKF